MSRKVEPKGRITYPSRRLLLKSGGGFALAWLLAGRSIKAVAAPGIPQNEIGPQEAFSFDSLEEKARQLAEDSFEPPVAPSPDVLEEINYDQYQRIRYRTDRTVQARDAAITRCNFSISASMREIPSASVSSKAAKPAS